MKCDEKPENFAFRITLYGFHGVQDWSDSQRVAGIVCQIVELVTPPTYKTNSSNFMLSSYGSILILLTVSPNVERTMEILQI